MHFRTPLTVLLPVLAMVSTEPLHAQVHPDPKGVVLVLIDDIGYGDIDCLHPSDLETPKLDRLCAQSVRLTDFHVGTTCSPSRASLLTGRSVNAGGVWHTIAGRDALRENEQTVAEVFRANGWRTGVFGKWHLGEGYPFAPRFRGFDVAVVHAGGGVGQLPDHWGNDYYSGVDFSGKPTKADVYLANGKPVTAGRHCTDYWFEHAKTFIRESVRDDKPFFCYVPTNAAHGPFNAPHGYKRGFDGLIENIDDNMGWLDEFLDKEGLKDDVLLIFTTDNGTAGKRLGGLRGKKGSHYDGGHNVPCFWRWKNGGIGGSTGTARDVSPLTAAMDLLPTFMDLFGLTPPEGGQPLHGTSLKQMLLNPAYVPTERTVVVDTQRSRHLVKWKNTCVMRDEVRDGAIVRKWRLARRNVISNFELYDFLVDRDTNQNIVADHADTVTALSAAYDTWWTDISQAADTYPPLVLNEDHEDELPLTAMAWVGGHGSPWTQGQVRTAAGGTRTHAIRFDKAGRYRFELRRWPREDGGAIDGPAKSGGGKVLPVRRARVTIGGVGAKTTAVKPGDVAAVIEMDAPGVETILQMAFLDEKGTVLCGAYYAYVRRIGDAEDGDGDGVADVVKSYSPPVMAKAYALLRFASSAELVAGRGGTLVCNGPADTVAIMSDGGETYRLDSNGFLWEYDSPDIAGKGTKLGKLFASAAVHALLSDGKGYYVHLKEAAAGHAKDAVVRFGSIADLLSGKAGKVATRGSGGSTALMSDGATYYKAEGGVRLKSSPDLNSVITSYDVKLEGDLFCGRNHTGLFSDGEAYYVQITAPAQLR